MLASLAVLHGTPQGGGGPGRVLIIGLDGVRSDAMRLATTPNINGLIDTGTVSWTAFAGGALASSDPTHQLTSSGPGWSSILTGVWVNHHGVADNSYAGSNFANYPHFFSHARAAMPTANLASIVHWSPINTQMLDPFPGLATYSTELSSDAAVATEAANYLTNDDPDILFVHLDDGDHAGHTYGFSPGLTSYLSAIEVLDAHVGTILSALYARPNYGSENWLVLVTTDHGGRNTSHGGHSPSEREIWMVANGGAVATTTIDPGPGHASIATTALEHFGVTLQPSWSLVPSFALPRPTAYAPKPRDHEPHVATLPAMSWAPAVDAAAYQVYLGTTPALGPAELMGTTTLTHYYPSRLPADTVHYWRIDALTGSGTVTGPVWEFRTAGAMLQDLVLHADYQQRVDDRSLHVPSAIASGNPAYVAGPEGAALSLQNANQFVSYGTPAALSLGVVTDFSVAFWIRSDGFSSDPAFVANKDWASGSNTGWVIAGDSGGTWQWNYCGASGSRLDYDMAGQIADGAWHLVTVTHDRDGLVRFYQDGVALTAGALNSPGTIDALATVVGQDGTLTYGSGNQAEIDELRIWRRVLGHHEVSRLWAGGPGERWRSLPGGSLGAGGVAEFDGAGPLTGGSMTSLILNTHAGPSISVIGFGNEPANSPLFGATLTPSPVTTLTLLTNTTGHGSMSFVWPHGIPSGQQYWLQAWILDATSASGLVASNGLLITNH